MAASVKVNPVYLFVMTSAFFWGGNFVLAGPVLADLPPIWAATMRFMLGAALMLAIAWGRGEDLLGLARRHGGAYMLLGLVGIVGFNVLFFRAMQSTSADNGALIMATNPLLTTLLAALLLGERATSRQLLALPVALAGVAVVVTHGDPGRLAGLRLDEGDVLMLLANLTWALFNVASRRFMPKDSPVGSTALMMTSGAGMLLLLALASGAPVAMPGTHAAAAMAVMVVGGTVLAYLFWGMGIQRLGAGRTSLFLNLVPVFAMLIGSAMGTLPTSAQLTGGAIVLAGVTLAMLPRRQAAT